MKTTTMPLGGVGAPTPAGRSRAAKKLAAFEARADVKKMFRKVQSSNAFTLEGAEAAFSKVKLRAR